MAGLLMLGAGRLNRRISFQQATVTRDSKGAENLTWANIGTNPTVWAEVRETRGKELVKAGAERSYIDALFTIRHRTDLSRKMRIVYGSRNYDIESIAFSCPLNEYIEIAAKAVL